MLIQSFNKAIIYRLPGCILGSFGDEQIESCLYFFGTHILVNEIKMINNVSQICNMLNI